MRCSSFQVGPSWICRTLLQPPESLCHGTRDLSAGEVSHCSSLAHILSYQGIQCFFCHLKPLKKPSLAISARRNLEYQMKFKNIFMQVTNMNIPAAP
ncbi:hypothetical protein AV530_004231 [Patagioenas fasciata monilis]|uniref:Uncharacterized protein n=1 Tax=Patagioenas fasciata monilis TaxID=372326 RepID=A0A1V4K8Y1_PATFA|nr:hypothetical protein AV530_004231 [Patagioenas fasciata monilis]